MAKVYVRNDGEWEEIGEAVEMTLRFSSDGGDLEPPPGVCPECCRVPLSDQPIVCPHGITLPGLL